LYPYATTSPIYVTVEGSNPKPAEDAAYFIAWIDRLIEAAKSNQDWNAEAEKNAVLELLASARQIYVRMGGTSKGDRPRAQAREE
jgi:TolB protein